jgi:hypothetical protein
VATILTPNVVNSEELIQILRAAGIDTTNISTFAKNYGIKKPKTADVEYIDKRTGKPNRVSTYKNPVSFYIKPSAAELTKIKKQQDFKDSKEKESEPLVQTVRYDKTLGAFVNPADDVVSQAGLLNWVAENPIKSVAGTTAPALLTKKGRALGKSALAKTAWLATPLPLAGSLALTNQDRSASEMLSDPWNWAGVAAMDTATKATGLADKTGKLASTMRLGMSPGMIRGASRFLGLPGLVLSLGMTAYDQYKKYQDKEGFVYDLFNEDVDTTSV